MSRTYIFREKRAGEYGSNDFDLICGTHATIAEGAGQW